MLKFFLVDYKYSQIRAILQELPATTPHAQRRFKALFRLDRFGCQSLVFQFTLGRLGRWDYAVRPKRQRLGVCVLYRLGHFARPSVDLPKSLGQVQTLCESGSFESNKVKTGEKQSNLCLIDFLASKSSQKIFFSVFETENLKKLCLQFKG